MAEQHTIQVDIVSAEGEMFSGPATMVFAPGVRGGYRGAAASRAAPFAAQAGRGAGADPGRTGAALLRGRGAIEVQPSKVTVLADTALRAKDIDEAAALAAKQRAEEALRDRSGHITQAEALAELARAAAQLKIIERLRKLRS